MDLATAVITLVCVVFLERRITKQSHEISDLKSELRRIKQRLGLNVQDDQLTSVVELLKANRVEEATQLLKSHKLESV